MASLTLRIPDRLEAELEAESKERGISKSDIARAALLGHLNVSRLRRLREKLAPYVEARGVFSEDNVLRRLKE